MKPTDFSYYLSDFLTGYLAGQRNLSTNTIKSYRDTFVLLLEYIRDNRGLSPEKVSIKLIDKTLVEKFLQWLETTRNSCIATRNQRLAAIHAFFRYLQTQKPEYLFHSQKILFVPLKKAFKPVVGFLSEGAMKQILSKPDVSTPSGRRDLTLLSTLYDTGARVQELADLTVRNIRLESPSVVSINGKGRKTRYVPIMEQTAQLLGIYIKEQNLMTPEKLEHPLFFNKQGLKLTRQGIAYILKKYATIDETENITPHVIRHTKAMHMTQADINPVFIRDFLGHSDLKTTGIYARTSIEVKRKALEKMNNTVIPASTPTWNTDENLMNWLNSLCRN